MKKLLSFLVALQLSLFVVMNVHAAKEGVEVDYLSLAELLLQDGNYDRASAALNEVNLDAVCRKMPALPRWCVLKSF